MNPLHAAIATATVLAASLFAATSFADEAESGPNPGGSSTEPAATPSSAQPPNSAYSRRVYKVDDIGMIIGGASEDGKAKVGRLPVQK